MMRIGCRQADQPNKPDLYDIIRASLSLTLQVNAGSHKSDYPVL